MFCTFVKGIPGDFQLKKFESCNKAVTHLRYVVTSGRANLSSKTNRNGKAYISSGYNIYDHLFFGSEPLNIKSEKDTSRRNVVFNKMLTCMGSLGDFK